MATKELSQSEIWDDSALVDSWNEALEEYKKYHSIAARGERVEDILAAEEGATTSAPGKTLTTDEDSAGGLPAWGPKEDEVLEDAQQTDAGVGASANLEQRPSEQHHNLQANTIAAAMPQALMSTVHDENLKNLMMSWYYAGYYTGLYEGQQKASVGQQGNQTNGNSG